MRASFPACRTDPSRFFLPLACFLALGCTGCLIFEKETLVAIIAPERDEASALLVYEGMHVEGSSKEDLLKANKALRAAFKDRRAFYLGNPLALIELDEPQKGGTEFDELLTGHLAITTAKLGLDRQGRLCGYQEIKIRRLKEFIKGLNKEVSKELTQECGKALASKEKPADGWDLETLRRVNQAAGNKFAWLAVDDGRVSFTMPGTPAFFQKFKRDLLMSSLPPEFRAPEPLGGPILARVRQPRLKLPNEETFLRGVSDLERLVRLLADTPFSLEQRPDSLTISLGLGRGQPVQLAIDNGDLGRKQFEDELAAYANKLSPIVDSAMDTREIVDSFVKQLTTRSK
jgi:hypothetical protein